MFDLTAYNTFNLTVFCKEGREIYSTEDLERPIEGPYIILGGGSDVLFTEDFAGTVLINKFTGISLTTVYSDGQELEQILKPFKGAGADDEVVQTLTAAQSMSTEPPATGDKEVAYYKVRIGGAEVLDSTIELLLERGINGLENLSLIPGTVGAAPIQNVGAYGVEIGNVIDSVEAYDLSTKQTMILKRKDCKFGYRSSIFKHPHAKSWFITHVTLKLKPGFNPHQNYAGLQSFEFKNAQAVRNQVIALRNSKLPNPKYVGNAGSFFKNPYVTADFLSKLKTQYEVVPAYAQADGSYKLAAGWLIDKAGCRGIRHGHAGTWGNQALVIVNLGQAKPHEIVAMAKYVSAEVKTKFGLELMPEVRLYGRHGEREWDQI